MICADGLSGIKDAITAAYPLAEYQRCIVHVVRNTLKYVADKDKKAFANDLKTIYHAPDEQTALARLGEVRTAWEAKYPGCMNRWSDNWDCISPMFKFSQTARKPEQRIPPVEPWPHDLPQRHGPDQGALSGDLGADEKMDHARSKLGAGLCRAGHHVPRQAAPELAADRGRNGGSAFNRRQP